MIEVKIHPSIDIRLHPGINPPLYAATRECLRITYAALGALADHKHRRAPRPDIRAAVRCLDPNLDELYRLRELMGLAGVDTAEVESDITRVESARARLAKECS